MRAATVAFAFAALAVADNAANFDRDTAPQGYGAQSSGYVVSQISDGQASHTPSDHFILGSS